MMTVGELRAALGGVPDDTPLMINDIHGLTWPEWVGCQELEEPTRAVADGELLSAGTPVFVIDTDTLSDEDTDDAEDGEPKSSLGIFVDPEVLRLLQSPSTITNKLNSMPEAAKTKAFERWATVNVERSK